MKVIYKVIHKVTHKKMYKISMLITLSILLSACQLNNYKKDDMSQKPLVLSYGNYYLWLKSLSSTELYLEKKQLKNRLSLVKSEGDNKYQYESKLLLIYSLPNPAVYQPYKAKALLNKYPLPEDSNNKTDKNLAFMVMLRDQLNSQLHLLSKQEKIKVAYSNELTKKEAEVLRIKTQLAQLKAIEKRISGHSLTNEQQ